MKIAIKLGALLLFSVLASCNETPINPKNDLQPINNIKIKPVLSNFSPAVSGASSFSATVNGKNWSLGSRTSDSTSTNPPDSTTTSTPDSFYATFVSDTTSLIILANGNYDGFKDAKFAQILLWVRYFDGVGRYDLSVSDSSSLAVFSVVKSDGIFNQYASSNKDAGVIHINGYDRVNKTISGDFQFTAVSAVGDSSVVIQNGKFVGVPIQR